MYFVCAIVKDEHDYIREWVEYNINMGFDKIVLYDNLSARPYTAELGDYMGAGVVEIKLWDDTTGRRQLSAYNDFVGSRVWGDGDYCAFLDVDEFIVFDGGLTVAEFIAARVHDSGIGLFWECFGADGRVESPNGVIPTTVAYTQVVTHVRNNVVKVICKMQSVDRFTSPHFFIPRAGYAPPQTLQGSPINRYDPEQLTYDGGRVKHYITKSWADYLKRLKRGNITRGIRNIDTFFKLNKDMAHLAPELTKDLDLREFKSLYYAYAPRDREW